MVDYVMVGTKTNKTTDLEEVALLESKSKTKI